MTFGEFRRLTTSLPDDDEMYLCIEGSYFDVALDSIRVERVDIEKDVDGTFVHSVVLSLKSPGLAEMIDAREHIDSAIVELQHAIRDLGKILPE